jgi:hypothetical protein
MKIIEAISRVDDLKPANNYDFEQKIGWLSQLDLMIQNRVIDTHEDAPETVFTGYPADVDVQTELIAPTPFDEMYIYWLKARIDLANGEYNRYNVEITMFETEWQAFCADYNSKHMPITAGKGIILF